jgi:hypothetical protein
MIFVYRVFYRVNLNILTSFGDAFLYHRHVTHVDETKVDIIFTYGPSFCSKSWPTCFLFENNAHQ